MKLTRMATQLSFRRAPLRAAGVLAMNAGQTGLARAIAGGARLPCPMGNARATISSDDRLCPDRQVNRATVPPVDQDGPVPAGGGDRRG